ncbi:mannonate dehydratase [Cloacibacillus evryensis]|uniref:Mannonate dehydratase n=1 Tax=Cloacibacillus evryensis TaxID=508460 RepID=A0AAW5K3S6_9BACT|nr:mannonate dehydratase [Cloacibacillus evryensis]EHL70788.1 mannonate dehydratase [Synergistes sp. 3_1_syn1]MCQ4813198.1 mannonate dehydratase [Cloacibacillus evryensis]
MKMTFRWYGEKNDSIPLKYIKQIPGCSGLMGFIDKAAGALWSEQEIKEYVDHVHAAGLEVEVIESVNVHEDIKLGLPSREEYIDNYIKTIENLAKYGVKVIVYNFMPVFDWLRTDLAREIPEDGSNSLYYDEAELAGMTPVDIVESTAKNSKGFTLPGWEPERLKDLERVLALYKGVAPDDLRANYKYFLEKIVPTCEKCGVRMAVHPDDPAWPVFGLPRIAHTQDDFDKIVSFADSPANALCLCTGSLGSNPENDIHGAIRHFGEKNRIACVHVRNVKYLGHRKFREAAHLSSDGSLDMYEIMKAIYETTPETYIRPDHGRMIWDEKGRPGYGLYDRALGIAYLNGLWEALDKGQKR